jgi:tartrate dehydrogenase/decarboxylase/D-malate dehydrogenase
MFEPIHGSAPDIAGRNIANPIGAIWSGALMLEHLGEQQAADLIVTAIEKAVGQGQLTKDLGGTAKTSQVTDHIFNSINTL